jgi:hypothetical protein
MMLLMVDFYVRHPESSPLVTSVTAGFVVLPA